MSKFKIVMRPTVGSLAELGEERLPKGAGVIVQRGDSPRWLVMGCPCGCGEEVRINLDRRAGKAWRFYRGLKKGMSLFPSVWRDTGCESHFIVWNGHVYLFGRYSVEPDDREPSQYDVLLVSALRSRLGHSPVNYVDLADELGKVPWDVLDALKSLVRSGEVIEDKDRDGGWFRLA